MKKYDILFRCISDIDKSIPLQENVGGVICLIQKGPIDIPIGHIYYNNDYLNKVVKDGKAALFMNYLKIKRDHLTSHDYDDPILIELFCIINFVSKAVFDHRIQLDYICKKWDEFCNHNSIHINDL